MTDITVRFGSRLALDGVTLEVAPDQIVAVMGESGSGKTSLLRTAAGLIVPDSGAVHWGEEDITHIPTHLRRFGLMFQDYALFPHLSVAANVAFGLRMLGTSNTELLPTVDRMLALVGLGGAGERRVDELSGGEQQRVALARTLAPQPRLVLLDEPLGALDRARRDQLLGDMQQIFAQLGVSAIYVTHDHHEAFTIADRVCVLDRGAAVASGTPQELWNRPQRRVVATLLGFPIIEGVRVDQGSVRFAGRAVPVPLRDGTYDLAVAPAAIRIDERGDVPVQIRARRFVDGVSYAVVELGGGDVLAVAGPDASLGPARAVIDGTRLLPVG